MKSIFPKLESFNVRIDINEVNLMYDMLFIFIYAQECI